jgi:aryl-alcohol dehydrogenase-like predicted oxidoreductase
MTNKLCLGTAKIGMPDYGYSDGNALKDPTNFILRSLDLGIRSIDTSPRYGNSEELIGKALKLCSKKPLINTKIDNLTPNLSKTPELMLNSINDSIHKLGASIDICYLHQNEIDIISDKYVHKGIELLKNSNLIKEVGTSVYSKEELMYTLDCGIFDWVQIPVNILDTSFYHVVDKYDSQIKVSARSIFLQGIILNDQWVRTGIKEHNELLNTLNMVRGLCSNFGITIQQLSIAYLTSLDRIDQIIVGTISNNKLRDNISSTKIQLDELLTFAIDDISSTSKPWTNPRNWQR